VGVNYATNSGLAARYPNEWEFFARYAALQQEDGARFDLGGQIDYNLSVKGVDGELSVARREGPLRVVAVSRLIADTLGGSKSRLAFGGGGTLQLGRFLALAADAATLTGRAPGEKVVWSAGLHIALPNTPHTLSLHVSNAGTSTLQGLARGGNTRRYGFEFTIPVHVSRFFTNPEATAVAGETPVAGAASTVADSVAPARPIPTTTPDSARKATPDSARKTAPDSARTRPAAAAPARPAAKQTPPARPAAPVGSKSITARMKGQAFIPDHIVIGAGTTVQWKNFDAMIHTVTAVDKSFNSGTIAADGSYSHTFTTPGTYPVYCMLHPLMKATIVVK